MGFCFGCFFFTKQFNDSIVITSTKIEDRLVTMVRVGVPEHQIKQSRWNAAADLWNTIDRPFFFLKNLPFSTKKKTRKEAVGLEIPGKQREKKNSATSNGKFPAVEFNLLLIFQDLLSICVSSCDRWSPTADRPIHQPGPSVRC